MLCWLATPCLGVSELLLISFSLCKPVGFDCLSVEGESVRRSAKGFLILSQPMRDLVQGELVLKGSVQEEPEKAQGLKFVQPMRDLVQGELVLKGSVQGEPGKAQGLKFRRIKCESEGPGLLEVGMIAEGHRQLSSSAFGAGTASTRIDQDVQADTAAEGSVTGRGAYARRLEARRTCQLGSGEAVPYRPWVGTSDRTHRCSWGG